MRDPPDAGMNASSTQSGHTSTSGAQAPNAQALVDLLHLARRARHAGDVTELAFILVNETHALVPYRQAALYSEAGGLRALSGVSVADPQAPFVQWLNKLVAELRVRYGAQPRVVSMADVAAERATDWSEWLPSYLLWLPLRDTAHSGVVLLLAREQRWSDAELAVLGEWADIGAHAWRGKVGRVTGRHLFGALFDADIRRSSLDACMQALRRRSLPGVLRELVRCRMLRWTLLVAAVLCIPVHLSVLAPGELVAAHPAVIRAPLDGVIDQVLVQPNQSVKQGEPLFALDRTTADAHLSVARQSLATAEAEYRQQAQLAVFDAKGKSQLATARGTVAERQADVEYLRQQLARATVSAPRDGIVLFDDPSQLIGRPVVTGERLASVADAADAEIEAWLAPGDLIALHAGAPVMLYLNASPLSPLRATLRYVLYEATQRPDGTYAYRLRAALQNNDHTPRVGLKGTAKVSGDRVPLVYWILRRPLAIARQFLGV